MRDRSFLVANAQHGLCHIIYCSDGFCRLSGYSRAEVMQRPAVCDFLHGPLTSQHAISVVKEALAVGAEKHFEILYYRKDGRMDPRTIVLLEGLCKLINSNGNIGNQLETFRLVLITMPIAYTKIINFLLKRKDYGDSRNSYV
ncbi:Potassium voltage-gated channel subfamily H member 6 [Blattella germanica]|nr:Potassium voltage-gated channel subfamily H member 6 [Blattella germanica]